MKLLTKAILAKLPGLYSQEEVKDPLVVVKFFNPTGNWTWFATEGSEVCGECGMVDCHEPAHAAAPKDFLFFGLVQGHSTELGYFSLSALQSIRGPLGLGIERDLYWTPITLSQVEASLRNK